MGKILNNFVGILKENPTTYMDMMDYAKSMKKAQELLTDELSDGVYTDSTLEYCLEDGKIVGRAIASDGNLKKVLATFKKSIIDNTEYYELKKYYLTKFKCNENCLASTLFVDTYVIPLKSVEKSSIVGANHESELARTAKGQYDYEQPQENLHLFDEFNKEANAATCLLLNKKRVSSASEDTSETELEA